MPITDEALRTGELSYCKVRAITRVATPAIEAELVEQARFTTGAQLEAICRKYAAVVRHEYSYCHPHVHAYFYTHDYAHDHAHGHPYTHTLRRFLRLHLRYSHRYYRPWLERHR